MTEAPQTGPPTVPTPGTPAGEAARHDIDTAIQEVILEVSHRSEGRDIDDIVADLEQGLAARGITGQPEKWLEAVARDASGGQVYVQSNPALQAAVGERVDDEDRGSAAAAIEGQREDSGSTG